MANCFHSNHPLSAQLALPLSTCKRLAKVGGYISKAKLVRYDVTQGGVIDILFIPTLVNYIISCCNQRWAHPIRYSP